MPDRADERALLIYDGDCAFCRYWVDAWRAETGDRVIYAPAKEIAERFPEIPSARYRRAVQLIDVDGRRLEGARAVFRVLAMTPGRGWFMRLYEAPLVAPVSEWAYRLVARHRGAALRAAKLLWGPRPARPRYGLTAWIFLRGLALVYLFAFLSWLPQLPGLVGPDGILPAGSSVAVYQVAALAGAAAALAIFAGAFVWPALLAAWVLYRIVMSGAGDFAAFQWDNFLLEAGFLALFLVPFRTLRPEGGRVPACSTVVWLYRFLLFRALFSSGAAKLLYGDLGWKRLTAVRDHLETQPLPTTFAWHAHQLPAPILKAATAATLAIEIAVPFLFFLPRRARLAGAAVAAAYEIAVIAAGNYAHFAWLALALCLLLLDDAVIERFFPRLRPGKRPAPAPQGRAVGILAAAVVALGLAQTAAPFLPAGGLVPMLASVGTRLRLVNAYSLFATVQTTRQEIVIEGSMDGVAWKAYRLPHEPGDVKRAPGFVAPFQPRLDWHMWYAAATPPQANPWFGRLMAQLLTGSAPVRALFAEDPFPDAPPKFVRATLYRYRFTTPEERKLDGAWWRAAMRAEYLPPSSLGALQGVR